MNDPALQNFSKWYQLRSRRPDQPLVNLALAEWHIGQHEDEKAIALLREMHRQLATSHIDFTLPIVSGREEAYYQEWEQAGLTPETEIARKRQLLHWRMHTLLAELTGELHHSYEALRYLPESAESKAALGCALARAGHLHVAREYLQIAVAEMPFDQQAARAYYQVLHDVGMRIEARCFAKERKAFQALHPEQLPVEAWFADVERTGAELTSILIPCNNQWHYTESCLQAIENWTNLPYEIILIDNGSTDETRSLTESEHLRIVRNEENRGFPTAINQGLAAARGEYLVLLNNDTLVTPYWLEGLVNWLVLPKVGMVGPMSNETAPPQQLVAGYQQLEELPLFARQVQKQHSQQALSVERLKGFCLAVRRDVVQQIGPMDEQFGTGFFEDDDWSVRALQAGFQLLVAKDVYIHHFGNRTFQGMGLDTPALLAANFQKFHQKWGSAYSAGYRTVGQADPYMQPAERHERDAHATKIPESETALAKVSLCMIVRDEEHHLPEVLSDLQDLFAEMIVVDTGSQDHTREIARSAGAKVFEFPWIDDFAAARNVCLEHATGDWIFWLDADDRLPAAERTKLRQLFASLPDANVAYVMKCVCTNHQGNAPTVVDHIRLFRRADTHRWKYRVHEQILPALRQTGVQVVWSDVRITHVGYSDKEVRQRKLQRDLRILQLELDDQPNDPFTLFNLASIYQELQQPREILEYAGRSLALSHPSDSIVRKLYALLVQAHRSLQQPTEALARCEAGLQVYPKDVELLFLYGLLLKDSQRLQDAETAFRRLLASDEAPHFASIDSGLRGYKGKHNLATVLLELGREAEARVLWQECLAEQPSFTPARDALQRLST